MFVNIADDFNTEPYTLPNVQDNSSFEDFVNAEEKKILIKLFGKFFYDALIEGLLADPIEERWSNLRDGYTYTHFNKTYYWEGLKSMLIPYIYYRWLKCNTSHTTGVGVVIANTENSTISTPVYKMQEAWNEFVGIVIGTYQYGYGNNSLYGFLYNSGDVYIDVYPENEYSDFKVYLYDWFNFPEFNNALGI